MARRSARARTEAMPMEESVSPVETYLCDLREIRATGAGVAETSYYPALANLFNSIGQSLKPRVRCVMNLRNLGAGMPDGGLFTADQFERQTDLAPRQGQAPARGAIEAKGPGEDVDRVVRSQQVRDYLDRYGIVIVTNLREFRIVERGGSGGRSARGVEGGADAGGAGAGRPSGDPIEREAFKLAEDEEEFWRERVAHPVAAARELGGQFIEFIKRACLHAAPLVNPRDVAWFLASYARDALARVERRKDLPALQTVRKALEDALGMRFTDEQGEHFFRSTLVQTIFYGVFSAWVLWHRSDGPDRPAFNWRTAAWSLHVPFVRSLYEELSKPSRLGPLGLVEPLEWAADVLNRVETAEFFKRFAEDHAVQYFYEPFLQAYDPELRKQLGVWYTPPEIVKYQVARVDTVLREELDLPDGLADPNVVVLDPCCGTGAYLVETLKHIERTLTEKHGDALVGHDLKTAAMTRVFGFEILPAPFVISHLQLGLMLQKSGLPLSHTEGERVGVYLTNALTGWEPPTGPKATLPLPYPELQDERDAAERVKRTAKILVILGNPPYNAFAGVSPEEEHGLVDLYKRGLNTPVSGGGWGIKKFNLDDLYVRFFRLAERRIAEMTGKGVISFISNFSYLSDPSFVVMRERFLTEFDKLWFDCMNGDSRETGKQTPEGLPDPSVFSTEFNREGIRVGTAVCVMVRKAKREKKPIVRFRHFWGTRKRADLLSSLKKKRFDSAYAKAAPAKSNRASLVPEDVAEHYAEWPNLIDLCAIKPSNGLMEKRGGALVDIKREALEGRMKTYFNRNLSWEEYKSESHFLTINAASFTARTARSKATKAERFDAERIVRYVVRPFDTRWCYYTQVSSIWNRSRPHLWSQFWNKNAFLVTRFRATADPEGPPFSYVSSLLDDHYLVPDAVAIPIRLLNGDRLNKQQHATLFDMLGEAPDNEEPVANLSAKARAYLASVGIKNPDKSIETASLIWMHVLAIGFSKAYLADNADGIRRDWPRVPLPDSERLLRTSARRGASLAALLDTESGVAGITSGKLSACVRSVGVLSRLGGGAHLDPNKGDFALTVGWGHSGKGGAVMPGKGRGAERAFDADELAAIAEEAKARRISEEDAVRLLGGRTLDVYLNGKACWRNVPASVWEYTIGGYQVVKKWLSYREEAILGRALTPDEVREVTDMVRRLTAIVLLQPQLDANYEAVKAATYAWPMDT